MSRFCGIGGVFFVSKYSDFSAFFSFIESKNTQKRIVLLKKIKKIRAICTPFKYY